MDNWVRRPTFSWWLVWAGDAHSSGTSDLTSLPGLCSSFRYSRVLSLVLLFPLCNNMPFHHCTLSIIICFLSRQIHKDEGNNLAAEFDSLFFETTAAEEFEYVEDVFHGLIHEIQRERGERPLHLQPLFISEDKLAARGRPKSPRSNTDKKEERPQSKKTSPSFKLFNKSFKIFNWINLI